jgi:predicted dehydrogenase
MDSRDVLIVGLGQIGMGYDLHLDPATYVYSHARAFSQHPAFRVIGGVDPDAQRREIFTRTYSAPAYADLDAALATASPALVILAVPTQLHAQALRQVLEQSKVEAVLCEKPLSYDLAEAQAMLQLCERHGVRLYVNYMRRSDIGAVELKRRLAEGAVAPPIKAVVWYSKGFLHNGSHFFNLLQYWLGPMLDAQVLSPGRPAAQGDADIDARVTFERGTAVFLAAWEEAFSHYTVELLSPSGRLRYEQGGKLIEWRAVAPDPNFKGYVRLAPEPEIVASSMDRYQWHVADQLARALQGEPAELCSGAEALATLIDMTNILQRIRS